MIRQFIAEQQAAPKRSILHPSLYAAVQDFNKKNRRKTNEKFQENYN